MLGIRIPNFFKAITFPKNYQEDKKLAGIFSVRKDAGNDFTNLFYLPSAATKGIIAIVRARLIAAVSSL